MEKLTLPPTDLLSGEVQLPGSKSISNRALLLAALARGDTRLHNLLQADDTRYMLQALSELGVNVVRDGQAGQPDNVTVTGRNGPLVTEFVDLTLDLGLAGTALRPLTAALTLGKGRFILDGTQRMRERPIAALVDGLRQLGAQIHYTATEGFPPVQVTGTGLNGGTAIMAGNLSSQFLTSLLMAAPLAREPVVVEIDGEQVSKPYLAITVHLMRQFGATITHQNYQRFDIQPGGYESPGELLIEGDASSASYFLAAGAIAGPGVTVYGIGSDSVQGDVALIDVLRSMGAEVAMQPASITVRPAPQAAGLQAVDVDLNAIPDAAMTVAVLALFAKGTTTIRNIYNWRVKETDRLIAMSTELRKLGASVIEGRDFIAITPPDALAEATIDTYGDHRMAMCFSLACLGGVSVTINDPECVSKTFPAYFEHFARLSQSAVPNTV